MRVLAVSDLHGDLDAAWRALETAVPEVLISCGDWGDPDEVSLSGLERFTERLPVYTIYGNHDDLAALQAWRNRVGTPVLLPDGEPVSVGGLVLAGISGIWAKSNRKPFYITDEQVAEAAHRGARQGPVDILLTHGCPSGVADLTWQNRHGGQPCFLKAFDTIRPRLYLTGHLHRVQEYRTKDGRIVRNVGETPRGDATLIRMDGERLSVEALEF
jgi:Icc-related predicted phosphoesterase